MESEPLRALRDALDRLCPLAPEAWAALAARLSARPAAAGQVLLRAGEPATQVFFVASGLLREYYLDRDGGEATRRFCGAGEISGSLADLIAGGPSSVSIDVLEPGALLGVDWASVDALAERHPSMMKLLRRLAEALYVRKMRREFEMLTLSAAQRYQRFARDEPALVQRLPRRMIASYLGITPVHLSRIRAAERRGPAAPAPPGRT
jgi:CRP-like cAMP-binding protein